MDVFSSFPRAIVNRVWQLGKLERSTETGVTFTKLGFKDVIVDEDTLGSIDNSPQAANIDSDTLLYAKPNQMPTVNSAAFISDYLWYDTENDQYYEIVNASIGKNQELGVIEHIEFKIRPTEVLNDK